MLGQTRYTVLITFHGAKNLPIADMHNLSCDPFLEARLDAPACPQPEDEPPLLWRTPTQRCTRDPRWESHWVVGGVPQSGFTLEMAVKDEDANDRDDRLGKAYASFADGELCDGFEVRNREVKVLKRKGSVVPYIATYVAAVLPGQHLRKHNRVILSVRVLGRARSQTDDRVFTVGPNAYTQHFSPLIGSMLNRGDQYTHSQPSQETGDSKRPASASTFVATKLQLTGPTPKDLRHHYVGYNRFIVWIYTKSGVLGYLLNHSLRKQYRTIYSYNKRTRYGVVDAADEDFDLRLDKSGEGSQANEITEDASSSSTPAVVDKALTREQGTDAKQETNALAESFLELTRYGAGGRVYTYVLTLDSEWRFSETGDEFAIDFLSKHMMHANGAQIVCYAGEFFVRRIRDGSEDNDAESDDVEDDAEDKDPSHYELVIDNNSGTYRPPKDTLSTLQKWLADGRRLGGLGSVIAMDGFDERLQKMKADRKELKKRLAGGEVPKRTVAMRHGSSASSLRIGGRKYSSGEVQRLVDANEREEEESIHPVGDGKASSQKLPQSSTRDSGVHV